SMFGVGRGFAPGAPVGDGRLRLPGRPPAEPPPSSPAAAPSWPEASQADEPEPVAVFDPAQAQRELAQLARERARRLVELRDSVESGDDTAANGARSRLRELDALIAAKEAEIESAEGGAADGDGAVAQ